jgi:hypothetical protein
MPIDGTYGFVYCGANDIGFGVFVIQDGRVNGLPLTVAISAIATDGAIFCAADRMVTIGDIEMESPTTKMFMLTNSIIVMPSDDDAALHTEILKETLDAVHLAISFNPDRWLLVSEVVDMYIAARSAMQAKLAERTFLAPLNLTKETYLERMASLEPQLVARIAEDLVSYKLPAMSVIVAGIDPNGSHVYEVHDGESGCFNTIGYAAIGAGARHARAHFMLAGQCRSTSVAEAVWNTYLAKKRSEVAPGVGETTDIGMVGPRLGHNVTFNDPYNPALLKQLESVYKRTRRAEERARKATAKEMVEYVDRLEGQQQQKITSQEAAPSEGSPAGNSEKASE